MVAAFVIRTIVALRGTWLDDDWIMLDRVTDDAFDAGTSFTLYNSHFFPVLFALYRGVQVVAPGSHALATVLSELMAAAVVVIVYLVLRRLFGSRPLVVVLVIWFAFTPLNLVLSMWPAVAFYLLPFELALAASLLLLLRYLDRPTFGRRLAVVAAVAIGFLTFEKALILPFFLFALAAWLPIAEPTPLGTRRALHEHRRLWQMLAGVLAVYLAFYVALFLTRDESSSLSGFDFSIDALVRLAGNALFSAFGTSIFGGPWEWSSDTVEATADPPQVLVIVAIAALVAFVAWTCARRRYVWRGWLILAGWLVFDVVGLAYARLATHGPSIGSSYKFTADAAIPVMLIVAFALLPTRAESQKAAPTPNRAVTAVLGAALVVSMLVSYGGAVDAWESNPAKPYVANVRAGAPETSGIGMLAQVVPSRVLTQLFVPDNTTDVVLSAYSDRPQFRPAGERLLAVDRRGHIRPAHVVGWLARSGTDGDCGIEVTAPGRRVRLKGSPYPFGWFVHLSYYASQDFSADVALGDGSAQVPFREGTHDVFFRVGGGGSTLDFTGLPSDARLCITGATVGSLRFEDD